MESRVGIWGCCIWSDIDGFLKYQIILGWTGYIQKWIEIINFNFTIVVDNKEVIPLDAYIIDGQETDN